MAAASTNGQSEGTPMAPAPTFSYAQAAKRKSMTVPATPQTNGASASPSTTSPQPSGISKDPTVATDSKLSWAEDAADANTVVDDSVTADPPSQGPADVRNLHPVTNGINNHAPTHPSSPDFDASLTPSTAKEEDSPRRRSSTELSWRRKPQDADKSTTEIPDEASQASIDQAPPKPLKEAPVPVVNFWTQRAQGTKPKQVAANVAAKPQATAPALAETPKAITNNKTAAAPAFSAKSKPVEKGAPQDSATASGTASSVPSARHSPHGRNQSEFAAPRGRGGGGRGSSLESRGGRMSRNDQMTNQPQVPAIRDTQSWPTPETVQDEDRRKEQTKPEKQESSTASKPHGRNEWVTMPFTPTVKFETPIPVGGRRGGRISTRGGRDLGGRGGLSHASVSKGSGAPTSGETPADGLNRERSTSSAGRSSSLPNKSERNTSKRPSLPSDGSSQKKVDRTEGTSQSQLPVDTSASSQPLATTNGTPAENLVSTQETGDRTERRRSIATQTDTTSNGMQDPRPRRKSSRAADTEAGQTRPVDRKRSGSSGTAPKSNWQERRAEGANGRSAEPQRDQGLGPRERGEGRSERGGRGGRRGGFYNGHPPPNLQMPNGHMSFQSSSPHSAKSATFQPPFPPFSQNQRGYRPGPRSASIPSESPHARFPAVSPPTLPPYMNGGFEYGMMQSLPPFQMGPYMPQPQINMMLMNGIAQQLAYYFSVENLCKDMFLRKHMDGQGFVPVSFIANFHRMKSLTTDLEMIIYVARTIPDLEVRDFPDRTVLVRKGQDWHNFILGIEERDPSAQHEGPPPAEQPSQNSGYDQNGFPLNVAEAMFRPMPQHLPQPFAPVPTPSPVNGYSRSPSNRHSMSAIDSQMNFAPAMPAPRQPNESDALDEPDSFPDSQVSSLTVVSRPQATQTKQNSHASKTESDGSLGDGAVERRPESEERKPRPAAQTNGSEERDRSARLAEIKKDLTSPSPSRSHKARHSSVDLSAGPFWIKGQDHPQSLPEGGSEEPYVVIRQKGLQDRMESRLASHDMQVLYHFWSHFLVRNFNKQIYMEFCSLAHEDAEKSESLGMDRLLEYYTQALANHRTIRGRVARDYVELVKSEDPLGPRPAFKQLRKAMRDGALNLSNRKIISNMMDAELRAELER